MVTCRYLEHTFGRGPSTHPLRRTGNPICYSSSEIYEDSKGAGHAVLYPWICSAPYDVLRVLSVLESSQQRQFFVFASFRAYCLSIPIRPTFLLSAFDDTVRALNQITRAAHTSKLILSGQTRKTTF